MVRLRGTIALHATDSTIGTMHFAASDTRPAFVAVNLNGARMNSVIWADNTAVSEMNMANVESSLYLTAEQAAELGAALVAMAAEKMEVAR